jgi:hypothetical protein
MTVGTPADPLGRQANLGCLAGAHLRLGHFKEAAQFGEEAFRAGSVQGVLFGIAACVCLGDVERAHSRVTEPCLRARTGFDFSYPPYQGLC